MNEDIALHDKFLAPSFVLRNNKTQVDTFTSPASRCQSFPRDPSKSALRLPAIVQQANLVLEASKTEIGWLLID